MGNNRNDKFVFFKMEGSEEDNVYTSNHGDLREQVRFLSILQSLILHFKMFNYRTCIYLS